MAQVAITIMDETATSAAEPAEAIDRDHLTRMTFGDRGLEREILELFDRQAAILIARMRASDGAAVGALAHTLKGSAMGVGAGAVAGAAAALEQAVTAGERGVHIERLAEAIAAVRAMIAKLLAD